MDPCPPGRSRAYVVAIDGSNVYAPIPGALPCTEAGLVSLGMVIIDIKRLGSLSHLPYSGAVDPRELRKTERGPRWAQGEGVGLSAPGILRAQVVLVKWLPCDSVGGRQPLPVMIDGRPSEALALQE